MTRAIEILRAVERAPLRTVRYLDAKNLDTNGWRALNDLVDRGALLRLARGVYTAPPDGRDGRTWKPELETAGLAIATARHGNRNAILMGIGAARHWGAIPRAIGDTVIAVSTAGHRPVTTGSGTVHFIPRDLDRVEAVLEQTELGQGLVATTAQTLFDLLMRPKQGNEPDVAAYAARNLVPQVDAADFDEIIARVTRANDSVRKAARDLRDDR